MKTSTANAQQCIYKLGLLEQEFQFILSKHPADISVDEFDWMQIAFEQVPNCLHHLNLENDYETYVILWHHQAQKIEKLSILRRLPLQDNFMKLKTELLILNQNAMAKKNN